MTLGATLSLCRCHKNAVTKELSLSLSSVSVGCTSVIADAVGQWYLVGLMRTDILINQMRKINYSLHIIQESYSVKIIL